MIIPVDSLTRAVVDSMMLNLKVDFLEELLEHQSDTYSYLIIVFIASFTFLSGFAIWKFVKIPKEAVDQIKGEISKEFEESLDSKWNLFKEKLIVDQKNEFERLDKELLAVRTHFFRITATTFSDSASTEADRLNVILYYRNALKGYIALKKDKFITIVLGSLLEVLRQVVNPQEFVEAFKVLDFGSDFDKYLLFVINKVPDTLDDQKREVRQILLKWKGKRQ